ncbi:MAG: hypothetical protein ACPGJS_08450 [Flammeovirgaceae bacterium]
MLQFYVGKYASFCIIALIGFFTISSSTIYGQCTTGCTTTISSNDAGTYTIDGNANKLCITGGTFTGTLTLMNGADLCIATGVTFTPANFTINNNQTTVTNYGNFDYTPPSSPYEVSGSFINRGDFIIRGAVRITGSGSIDTQGSSFEITGSLDVQNDLDIVGDATVGGAMSITGGGTVTLQDGVLDVGGSFSNQGTVTASGASTCGQINVSGASQNLGNYGADNSFIDICDSSGTDDGFDVNFGTVGGNVTTCTCAGTLPVEFIFFRGELLDDVSVLRWATAIEKNSDSFIIERSFDLDEFEAIGFVKAQGNSNVYQDYSFIDAEGNTQTTYYRLKQLDIDGTFTYSKVISISPTYAPPSPQFYYAPSQQLLHINLPSSHKDEMYVYILQADGTLLSESKIEANTELSVEKLGIGMHIVRYQFGNYQGSWRFLKQ